jgi:hypothetical protein
MSVFFIIDTECPQYVLQDPAKAALASSIASVAASKIFLVVAS